MSRKNPGESAVGVVLMTAAIGVLAAAAQYTEMRVQTAIVIGAGLIAAAVAD